MAGRQAQDLLGQPSSTSSTHTTEEEFFFAEDAEGDAPQSIVTVTQELENDETGKEEEEEEERGRREEEVVRRRSKSLQDCTTPLLLTAMENAMKSDCPKWKRCMCQLLLYAHLGIATARDGKQGRRTEKKERNFYPFRLFFRCYAVSFSLFPPLA
jgi:hypothetical protein